MFGYGLRKLAIDPSPLIVAMVLGPLMEKTLRQALFMERGNVLVLVGRPLTAALLVIGAVVLVTPPLVRFLRGPRAASAPLSTTAP
jgi:putative tricarboxylic transport membrane protein